MATDISTTRDLLAGLNPEQRDAVTTIEGVLLVEAGAGTGKTQVLTTRIAYLIDQGLAQPHEILAVTFTNKAAKEMRQRVEAAVGAAAARQLVMGSFHAISLGWLRELAERVGLRDSGFLVLDEDEQLLVVREAMGDVGLADPEATRRGGRLRPSLAFRALAERFHAAIQSAKEDGLGPETDGLPVLQTDPALAESLVPVWRRYQERLLERNACDFADLLLHLVRLWDRDPALLARWSRQFRYILVDEFQDTNHLQYRWIRCLAAAHGNLCVVGDVDQCIYQWRNANPEIFLGFPSDWPRCKVVTLHRNYRSTQPILNAANRVVDHNPRRSPKRLDSGRQGVPVIVLSLEDQATEAMAIADDIARRAARGHDLARTAILVRTSRTMAPIEQQLKGRIPYVVIGGTRFFDRSEIRDALAYLRLLMDPADSLALQRIASRPTRRIGEATLGHVIDVMAREGVDAIVALRQAAADPSGSGRRAKEGLWSLADALEAGRHRLQSQAMTVGGLLQWIIDRVGYRRWLAETDEDANERNENLDELIQDAARYDDIGAYLQLAQTMSAADEIDESRAIRLMTIHAAKGLEFDLVYTPALEQETLPIASALGDPRRLAEERRICHVAWTRARHELVVSYARRRYNLNRSPSQFLREAGLTPVGPRPGPPAPPVRAGLTIRAGGWRR